MYGVEADAWEYGVWKVIRKVGMELGSVVYGRDGVGGGSCLGSLVSEKGDAWGVMNMVGMVSGKCGVGWGWCLGSVAYGRDGV